MVQTLQRTYSVCRRRNETLSFPFERTTEENEQGKVSSSHSQIKASYKYLSQISALLPLLPIKRRNIFQVKKVKLVSDIICLYENK